MRLKALLPALRFWSVSGMEPWSLYLRMLRGYRDFQVGYENLGRGGR